MDPSDRSYVPVGRGSSSGRGRGFRSIPSAAEAPKIASPAQIITEDEVTATPEVPRSSLETDTAEAQSLEQSDSGGSTHAGNSRKVESHSVLVTVGGLGQRCQCLTNFVELKQTGTVPVFEYLVSFKPTLESTRDKHKIVRQLENVIGPVSNFDGQSLFLPLKLSKDVIVVSCKNIHTGAEVETSVKFIKEREFKELCQFYNILFQRILTKLGFIEIRRGYYELSELRELPQHKLQVWPGISLNVEVKDGGVMIMIDAPKRIIQTDTAFDYYKAMQNADPQDFKAKFEKFIVGRIVRCNYNHKCYIIDDIDWSKNPTTEFPYKNRLISFKDYFKKQYNVKILDLEQPMLISRVKSKNSGHPCNDIADVRVSAVALVPETCLLSGLTSDQRSNYKVRAAIESVVQENPTSRVNSMRALIKRIFESEDAQKILSTWGITIHNDIMAVVGRAVQSPTLLFHKNEERIAQPNFRKECRSCYNPVEVTNFLVYCTVSDRYNAGNFIKQYSIACSTIGIRLRTQGDIIVVNGTTPTDYVRELEKHCNPNKVQFVVVVFPGMREDIYRAVKTFCLTVVPIPSQCILSRSLNQHAIQQTAFNVCVQINCKLGGSLWGLKTHVKRVMFIGMDAAHDQTRKNPSIIALVASMNDTCTSYFSRCAALPIHQEVNTCLRPMFLDALNCYRLNNGELPDRVIFFRDGGSASTFDILKTYEVDVCMEVLKEESSKCGKPTHFSYLCVAKRIPQRLFLCSEDTNIINPIPGTVVDTKITKPSLYDFYVVSQIVTQGAITPTHYTVLFESSPTDPDTMQKLAYATTFMYSNWPGTIKVPSVIQFAHKLGQLVSRIKAIPNRKMDQKLYFL